MLKPSQRKQQGQSLVEYALILVIVAVASIVAIGLIGPAINRGLGVTVGGLKGKMNAAAAPGVGASNVIYISSVPANSPYDSGGAVGQAVCTNNGTSRFVKLNIVTSSDIGQNDFIFTLDSKILPASLTGGPTWAAVVTLSSNASDKSVCPQSVVVTARKAIAIAPVVVY